jgi:hypothetical protein
VTGRPATRSHRGVSSVTGMTGADGGMSATLRNARTSL